MPARLSSLSAQALYEPENYGNQGGARPTSISTSDIPVFEPLFDYMDEGFKPVRMPPHAPPPARACAPLVASSAHRPSRQVIQRALHADGEAAAAASAGLLCSFRLVLAGLRGRAVARGHRPRPGCVRAPALAAGPRRPTARRPSQIGRSRAPASFLVRRRWPPRRVRPEHASSSTRWSARATVAASAASSRPSTRAPRAAPMRQPSARAGAFVCSMRMLCALWRRGLARPDGWHLVGSAALG